MDEKDRRRITRNLTALKERVGADLDHIVDKLIERDIFDIWIKDDIDNVLPPTPQRKADILLRKLIGSGKQAYPAFRDTLLERGGYDDLVYLMEPTKPEIQFSMNMAVSNDRKSESSSSNQEESELTSRKIESMDVEDEMLNKPSQVDTADDSSAMVSKEMLTAMMTKVDKLDERVDEKVQEMSEEVKVLKDALTKLSEERVSLLEKINDLHEKVAASNKENLKKKYKNKKNEMKALRKRNIELEKENINYIKEMKTLRAQVIRKDQEIEVLKKRVSRIENEPNKQAQTTESNCKDASAKFKLREWLSNLKMKVLFPPKFSKK